MHAPDTASPIPFFILFPLMWVFITTLLAYMSGWAKLGQRFRATAPPAGQRFRMVSGAMRNGLFPVNYGGCLTVAVDDGGFYLSILFLFRWQNPPLYLPWTKVVSLVEKRVLFSRLAVIHLGDDWPVITIRGRAGQALLLAHAKFLAGAQSAYTRMV